MRILEIILITLAVITALTDFIPAIRAREERAVLPFAAAVLLALHTVLEGARWQMLPLYVALTTQFLALGLPLFTAFNPPTGARKTGASIALGAALLSGVLGALMPVFGTPTPDGTYEVGTVSYHWVDETREEIYGPNPGGPREIMVQIWYPTDTSEGYERAPWVEAPRAYGRAMAGWVGLPAFVTGHFNLVDTHSYEDAPLIPGEDELPVLLSVHGWAGFRSINQDQSEALASHGYVVVAANHTHAAMMTDFPDGRLVPLDINTIPNREEVSEAAYQEGINTLVRVFAEDTIFMLEQLEALNDDDPDERFTGRLALAEVGYFGHSTGGGGAIEACAVETRCAALFGQDAWVEPVRDATIAEPGGQPLFLVDSSTWADEDDPNFERQKDLLANSPNPVALTTIEGTAHYDFTMVPLITPIAPTLGLKGPLNGERVTAINAAYLLAFFDTYLLGEPSGLMTGEVDTYPEVDFLDVPQR